MKHPLHLLLLSSALACLPPVVGRLHAESLRPPEVLFSLDFDSGLTARAQGGTEPDTVGTPPDLVPGKSGQAAFFGPGQVLRYPAKGNINKERGSIAVWFQTPVDGLGTDRGTAGRHTLFREDGPYVGRDTGTAWLWFHLGRGLRADVRDPRDRYIYLNQPQDWARGEWHHLVFTWDHTQGTHAYLDGEWASDSVATKWMPKNYDAFFVGAADAKGLHPWGAAIDELRIFDRELTEAEVRAEFLRHGAFSVRARVFESHLTVGREGHVRMEFYNPSDNSVVVSGLSFALTDASGVEVAAGRFADQTVAARSRVLVQAPASVAEAGELRLAVRYTESGAQKSLETTVRAHPLVEEVSGEPAKETFVVEVDAATARPIAESAPSSVVRAASGPYREAGPDLHDRFAIEFAIRDVGEPHVAVVTYPDDKARTIETMLQDLTGKRDAQAQIGLFTGDEYPLSGGLVEQRILFWPRSTRQSFVFMTAEQGKPAAVAKIKIHRLDRLAPAPAPRLFQGSVPAREIGFYYEDPVLNQNFGEPADFAGFSQALTKAMDYMQSFAQGTLLYPAVWYGGPLYGSTVEPTRHPGAVAGGVRPHPEDYPLYFTKRLHARGLTFNAGLHIHELSSMKPHAVTDLARIQAGEETVLNMRADGQLWHGHYHGSDPSYNPLDPRVQNAVAALVDEIAARYGDEPGFTGVSLVLARVKIFGFGSAESGYNDMNLAGFQRDTGVSIPGYKPDAPDRIAAAAEWLRANPVAWKKWIDWRCAGMHAHYKRVADALTARNPKLRLTLNLFTPRADYERMSDYLAGDPVEAWREQGIDPALYADDANIALAYTLVPADYRWRRNRNDRSADLEMNRTVFFAPESVAFMRHVPHPEIVIHDRYWEDAIGRKEPLRDLPVPENPWRVSTLNAGGRNSLEPYVAALNNTDALRITKGGYLIGTFGMEREIEEFTRAYRALPAVRFDDVPSVADPVRVRQKIVDGRLYFYVLNRMPDEVHVKLAFQSPASVEDLVSGEKASKAADFTLRLKPFELRAYAADGAAVSVIGGRAAVSAAVRERLKTGLDSALTHLAAIKKTHPQAFARFSPYAEFAKACWRDENYARLHFLLQEYWAVGSRKLADGAS